MKALSHIQKLYLILRGSISYILRYSISYIEALSDTSKNLKHWKFDLINRCSISCIEVRSQAYKLYLIYTWIFDLIHRSSISYIEASHRQIFDLIHRSSISDIDVRSHTQMFHLIHCSLISYKFYIINRRSTL